MKELLANLTNWRANVCTKRLLHSRRARLGATAVAGMCCLLLAGCNNREQLPVYPVQGYVLMNGKPLADAIVSFHAHDNTTLGAFPSAHTDADGKFVLTTYEHNDGAPQGAYSVSVVCFKARPLKRGQEGSAVNVVPHRYTSPESSGLNATVNPGSNELPAFKLKSM